MLVSELRRKLAAAVTASDATQRDQEVINQFLTALARHDDEQAEALVAMFELISFKKQPKRVVARPSSALTDIKAVLGDDAAFERAFDKIAGDKKMTKASLIDLYVGLFGSSDGVPAKATRSDLLELIRRERVKTVRNAKMHSYLTGQKKVS